MHGLNGLKYISTIVAVAMRTTNDLHRNMFWKILAASSSGLATIVNTYWDIVIDWGLLRKNSRNPWLRDKLSVPNKSVYYIAMVSCYFIAKMCVLWIRIHSIVKKILTMSSFTLPLIFIKCYMMKLDMVKFFPN